MTTYLYCDSLQEGFKYCDEDTKKILLTHWDVQNILLNMNKSQLTHSLYVKYSTSKKMQIAVYFTIYLYC